MENLWSPRRIDYILSTKPAGCIFCDKPAAKKDEDNYILYRGKHQTMRPDGFNLGINMGLVGGAGVADHIHLHIVPRWNEDTNFMPVLIDTRVISEALRATYGKLKETREELKQP
ncbi:MAG: hypothetical protein E4G89_00490 [Methanothrix sp.]|nr:MAG: hypothetical protein E4G89_00490 [Methanothrix sp.]